MRKHYDFSKAKRNPYGRRLRKEGSLTEEPVSKRNDLSEQLCEQINFIRKSCEHFDEGDPSEGKRIATAIRILVHDTSNSHSLLEQLEYKNKLQFVSRAEPYRTSYLKSNLEFRPTGPHLGLLNIQLGNQGGPRYVSKFNSVDARPMPFDEWWNETVLKDADDARYSRKKLVLFVANTDGGAHVDPEMDEAYEELSRKNHVGYEVAIGGKPIQWHENPVLPSIRQIGYEILETLASIT